MQRLRLSGIRAEGRHGARAGERDHPQPFVVDLDVVVDAGADDLGTTADYRQVVEVTRGLVAGESHALIETIAERVAGAVASLPGVVTCRVVVHKPEAAARLDVGDVSAEAVAGSPLPPGG
ncbi:MAG: dihydroneopterin aldolase [Actinomycetota bacterium]